MSIAGRFPGLLTWLHDHSNHHGMQNLRQNKDQGRIVARELVDSKRRELKDGTAKKDALSLLGSLPPLIPPTRMAAENFSTLVKSSDSQSQDRRLTDEEILPQVQ